MGWVITSFAMGLFIERLVNSFLCVHSICLQKLTMLDYATDTSRFAHDLEECMFVARVNI